MNWSWITSQPDASVFRGSEILKLIYLPMDTVTGAGEA